MDKTEEKRKKMSQPLAERLRPKTLDEYIGQKHLIGQGAVLRKMIEAGRVPSFILWGPPGVGKTTLAHIVAEKLKALFHEKGYPFYLESPTNQQFLIFENEKLQELGKHVTYSFWEPYDETHTVVRFATSWSTTDEDLEELAKYL